MGLKKSKLWILRTDMSRTSLAGAGHGVKKGLECLLEGSSYLKYIKECWQLGRERMYPTWLRPSITNQSASPSLSSVKLKQHWKPLFFASIEGFTFSHLPCPFGFSSSLLVSFIFSSSPLFFCNFSLLPSLPLFDPPVSVQFLCGCSAEHPAVAGLKQVQLFLPGRFLLYLWL